MSAESSRSAEADGLDAGQERERECEQALLDAGIHRLAIPTPFRVGRVNAYLIEDEPLTLVDSGPNSAKALDELEQALARLGHRVEDIGLLVITHQHLDHFGLASILARRSGAQVAALQALTPYLEAFGEEAEREDVYAERVMLRHGIPPEVVTALRAVSASFRGWGAKVHVDRPLSDGQQVRLRDRTLEVLHRPGHSPSDTVFLDSRRRMLLAGDHLIKHISSNAVITRPLGAPADFTGPRPRSLLTYIDSLKATQALDVEVILPGHGPPFDDHGALIDERLRMHARRAERILRSLSEGPRTAHEIAQELWGNVAVTQAYLTLSEVLGHLDLLAAGDEVAEIEQDGVVRFQAHDGR